MAWIVLPLLFVLNAGPSMHWGDVDAGLQAPLLWSTGMGIFVVAAGWRAGTRGRIASAVRAMCLAAIVNVPAYLAGHRLLMLLSDCAWFGKFGAACGG
jgi:hypothetical protein